jgi:hypothetical protein
MDLLAEQSFELYSIIIVDDITVKCQLIRYIKQPIHRSGVKHYVMWGVSTTDVS